MSWFSWSAPRTKEDIIKERQARTNFYRQGTVTSGKYAGKYLAEVRGEQQPRGPTIRENIRDISNALLESPALQIINPLGPLPTKISPDKSIVVEDSTTSDETHDNLKAHLRLAQPNQDTRNDAIANFLHEARVIQPDDTRPPPIDTEGLRLQINEPNKSAIDTLNELNQFLQEAATAKASNTEPHETVTKTDSTNSQAPLQHEEPQSGGQQLKRGFTVGGGEDQMLAWLASTAPAVLAAIATGAGGALGASAVKKIVGDAPGQLDSSTLNDRLFGLSAAEYQALQRAYSQHQAAGPPESFPAVLEATAPTSAINKRMTIPSADPAGTQMVADAALLTANSAGVTPTGIAPADSLVQALTMRGFGMGHKLLGNQNNTIVPPNVPDPAVTAQPSNPQASSSSLGAKLAEVAGETRSGIAGVAKQALADAATEVGSHVMGAAAPAITRMIGSAGSRIGGWLASGISSLASSLTKKIVGDDPSMPGTTGRVRRIIADEKLRTTPTKIVGDAPVLADTNDSTSAAIAMASSRIVQFAAARLVMEQLGSTMIPMSPLASKEEIGQAVIAAAQPDFTLYNNEPIDVESERAGMTIWPRILPWWDTTTANWRYIRQDPVFMRTTLVQPERSVPIRETPLAASIAPMLLGAPITEYSGALRIKTMRTDFDMLMTVLGRVVPDMMTDGGYAATRPASVLLSLMAAWGMPPGEECTCVLSGVAYRQFAEYPVPLGQSFPATTNIGQFWRGAVAWVSLDQYAQALNGMTTGANGAPARWDDRFTPDKWDISCAVVMIYQEEMNDGTGNVVRVLMSCEHPFLMATYPLQWLELQQDGYEEINWQQQYAPTQMDRTGFPNSLLNYIEGPNEAVLFVVVDMPRRRPAVIVVGTVVPMVVGNDNTPDNPLVVQPGQEHPLIPAVQLDMTLPDFPSALVVQMQRLEQQVLTASDRSSAIRLVSDVSVRFGATKSYVRTMPGNVDQLQGYGAAFNPATTGLPVMYRAQARREFIAAVDQTMTSASGRIARVLPVAGQADRLDITHRMARWSSMLHLLSMRGMIMWEEEKAQVPISSPFSICEVMYEVGLLIAAITDVVMSSESQTVSCLYENMDPFVNVHNTLLRLNKRNRIWPLLQRAFMAGIQYPTTVPTYENSEFPIAQAEYAEFYDALSANTPRVTVPWLGLNRYFGGLVPPSPVIALHMLSTLSPPQYEQILVTTGQQQRPRYMNAFDVQPTQTAIVDEVSKLSLSAVPDTRHLNPALFSADFPTTSNITLQGMPVTAPDASWSRAVAYSIYNAGVIDQRTECTSLPIGTQLPIFNLKTGKRKRYFLDGYSSIFRMPGGSAAIRIITSPDTPAGLVDADLFPADYPWLYQSGGGVRFDG